MCWDCAGSQDPAVYSSGQAFAARIGLNDSCRNPVGTLPIGPRVEVMPDSSGGGSFGETVCTRCWTWRVAAPCGREGYASRKCTRCSDGWRQVKALPVPHHFQTPPPSPRLLVALVALALPLFCA
jgi:hypothetical protein